VSTLAAATLALIIGLLTGAMLGALVMACCCMASQAGGDDVSTER